MVKYKINNTGGAVMSKPPFSHKEAVRAATISNQIEGYQPTKDKKSKRVSISFKIDKILPFLKSHIFAKDCKF